ncbi:MAG: DUF1616 domain-containing protein [Dehalococcoidia bacterium]
MSNNKILFIIVFITLLLFLLVAFTEGIPRSIIGAIAIIFFPGYTLLAAIFPRRGDLLWIERVGLSFGLSIAIVAMSGLILNYTPWGIRLYPVLTTIASFVVITSVIGWYRQRRLSEAERLTVNLKLNFSGWQTWTKFEKSLSIVLALAILVALGALYVIAAPKQGEKYTEFYVLGTTGKASDYPRVVLNGETVHLTAVVVNYEHESTAYRIEIRIDGEVVKQIATEKLDNGQKWENQIDFVPQKQGENQKVEFYLYQNGMEQPYFDTPLYMYIDVL